MSSLDLPHPAIAGWIGLAKSRGAFRDDVFSPSPSRMFEASASSASPTRGLWGAYITTRVLVVYLPPPFPRISSISGPVPPALSHRLTARGRVDSIVLR